MASAFRPTNFPSHKIKERRLRRLIGVLPISSTNSLSLCHSAYHHAHGGNRAHGAVLRFAPALRVPTRCAWRSSEGIGTGNISFRAERGFSTPAAHRTGNWAQEATCSDPRLVPASLALPSYSVRLPLLIYTRKDIKTYGSSPSKVGRKTRAMGRFVQTRFSRFP